MFGKIQLYEEMAVAQSVSEFIKCCDLDDLAMLVSSTLTDDPVQVRGCDYEGTLSQIFQNGYPVSVEGLEIEEAAD